MSVKFVQGDLLASPSLSAIAHGCNCAGAMGKGIALGIKNRWPKMFAEYKKRCLAKEFKLGDVFVWQENGMTIFNLGTQTSWKTKADVSAIRVSVNEMLRLAEKMQLLEVGLPKIGAGLGGADWREIRALLIEGCHLSRVNLIVFEDYVLGKPMSVQV